MDLDAGKTDVQVNADLPQQPGFHRYARIVMQDERLQIGIWMALVFVIALLLRASKLDSVPANLNPDEADNLTTYLLAKYTGYPSILGFSWNGAPALNAYLIGWGWELSGQSIAGLRITSALLTAAGCSLFFLLFYLVSDKKGLALGLALLFMTNPWFLNFSRSGWENAWNAVTVLLIVLGFYTLYEQKNTKGALCLLITGAAAGFYFYHPGKLYIPAIVVLLLLGQFVPAYRVSYSTVAVFVVVSSLLILPQLGPLLCTNIAVAHQSPRLSSVLTPSCMVVNQKLLHMSQAKQLPIRIQKDGWHRIGKVSVLAQDEPFDLLRESIQKNSLGFLRFARKDFNAPLNKRYIPLESPPIAPILTGLYLMGLLISAVKFPYIPLFYLMVLLPVQVLSMRTPDAARAVHIVPLIFFFSGVCIHWILELSRRYSPLRFHGLYPLVIAGMMGMALHQGMVYWHWIHSPQALEAREPSVAGTQYPEWLQTLTRRIQADNAGSVSQR